MRGAGHHVPADRGAGWKAKLSPQLEKREDWEVSPPRPTTKGNDSLWKPQSFFNLRLKKDATQVHVYL